MAASVCCLWKVINPCSLQSCLEVEDELPQRYQYTEDLICAKNGIRSFTSISNTILTQILFEKKKKKIVPLCDHNKLFQMRKPMC